MSGFREYFEQNFGVCKTWDIYQTQYFDFGNGGEFGDIGQLNRLIDHGFIVNAAPLYANLAGMDTDLFGHEIAIVSRTYCNDDEIDNPPDGLKCVRLPDRFLGDDPESSTVIMTVITGNTPTALALLNCCADLPAGLIGLALSREMLDLGYRVYVDPINPATYSVRFLIVDSTDDLPDSDP